MGHSLWLTFLVANWQFPSSDKIKITIYITLKMFNIVKGNKFMIDSSLLNFQTILEMWEFEVRPPYKILFSNFKANVTITRLLNLSFLTWYFNHSYSSKKPSNDAQMCNYFYN